jgi:hypothetical protein
MLSFDGADIIRLKRDSTTHTWTIAVGGHWVTLPWSETADAVSVVMWVKARTDGTAKVSIEL